MGGDGYVYGLGGDVQVCLLIPKLIKLHTLNVDSVFYGEDISIKCFFVKKKNFTELFLAFTYILA